ncbi:MAG: hypothetical protein K0Q83_2820, partial [Deltaproteobacteria bacterium]|nr:hypothetical protein [Deltaproteobacteria bacterium]
ELIREITTKIKEVVSVTPRAQLHDRTRDQLLLSPFDFK